MATEEPIVAAAPEPATVESPAKEIEEPKSESQKVKKAKETKPKKTSKPRNPTSHPTYEEVRSNSLFSIVLHF